MKKLTANAKRLLIINLKNLINNYISVAIMNHNQQVAELSNEQDNNASTNHKNTAVKSRYSIVGIKHPTVSNIKQKQLCCCNCLNL
ncbi:MAG: hypothetical protein IJN87_07470 [Firmicutes bacterium]|nr:hypothetical protein [Clostridia bacterium]MBQ7050449.1 hypothetical protein [Bacillota bacterium]